MVHYKCLVLFHLLLPQPPEYSRGQPCLPDHMPRASLILDTVHLLIFSTHRAEWTLIWVVSGLRTLDQEKTGSSEEEQQNKKLNSPHPPSRGDGGRDSYSELENHFKILWNQKAYRGMHMAKNLCFHVLVGHISSLEPSAQNLLPVFKN